MAPPEVGAESFTLKQLFQAAIYDIEYYQREYAWSGDEVATLIRDLWNEFEPQLRSGTYPRRSTDIEPYFLGPFVYYENTKNSRFLVDGQQRFTTLHLIFIRLYRAAKDYGDERSAEQLSGVITDFDDRTERFRVDIEERREALHRFYAGKDFEPPRNSSLSLRNICRRYAQIGELVDEYVDSTTIRPFVRWLLNHVVLVGIQAASRNSSFRIFESMNDRGAQLTQVDLVKSYLLSHVGTNEEELNKRWREMLAEVTQIREDRDAPKRFLSAVLIAQWARVSEDDDADEKEIIQSVNNWIRNPDHSDRTQLKEKDADTFFRFLNELLGFAKLYMSFLRATNEPYEANKLGAIFFNHVNGLDNQMQLILAAVRSTDTQTAANKKAALVASFLDRLFVIRALEFEPVDARSFDQDIRSLIPKLRECATDEDVASVLAERYDHYDFQSVLTFRLQGNNKAQVRYLLARLTSYTQKGCKKPDLIREYLDPDRRWQVEHLPPDHPEWYASELPDAVEFRTLRARVGALALLPDRDNNSLNDMPLMEKVKRYGRQNALIAVLESNYRKNHPDLKDFVKENSIEGQFRDFGPDAPLQSIVNTRAELYRRLCQRIWHIEAIALNKDDETTEHLGTSLPESPPKQTPVKPRRPLQTTVAKMVRSGVLKPGTKVVGRHGNVDYFATVDGEGRVVLSGEPYDKVDDAARIACGKKQDGMSFWKVPTPEGVGPSLRELNANGSTTTRRAPTSRRK